MDIHHSWTSTTHGRTDIHQSKAPTTNELSPPVKLSYQMHKVFHSLSVHAACSRNQYEAFRPLTGLTTPQEPLNDTQLGLLNPGTSTGARIETSTRAGLLKKQIQWLLQKQVKGL
ncbi:hypothetical protein DPMN_193712 [Dreissena polymorpha]|uniref:Uncharacterized protein n=1 Tax=Dreissena polymorpha TaxID=45954 RepID=A0A9D4B517_DREPO|nr:hypothetical protein DPMN_193712 [Dreissena polymorpha]